jgi:ligand-binding SRPBCC domain-containing protein
VSLVTFSSSSGRSRHVHVLERAQRVEQPAEQAFAFYADARNLEAITPTWLRFRVVTPGPIEMRAGTLIDYRLSLHGAPIRWRTRIEVWEPPLRFLDVQLSGPYALWEHTHRFVALGERAVEIRDHVRYALPLGPIGELAHALFVRRDLERIFDFRRDAVDARLGAAAGPG